MGLLPSNDGPSAGARGRWRRRVGLRRAARAAFVLFHLHAVCVLALPSPGAGLRRAAWKDPTVQAEFRSWAATLSSLGLATTPASLEAFAWTAARRWVDWQGRLAVLARPYAEVTGARQPWRMFVAPHRYPSVLHLEVDEGDGFVPVYVARSDTYTWQRRLLDHDRMRAAVFRYAWPSYEGSYRALAAFLARRARRAFPAALRFRARFAKARTPTPEEVLRGVRPPVRFVRPVTFDLHRLEPPEAVR